MTFFSAMNPELKKAYAIKMMTRFRYDKPLYTFWTNVYRQIQK